MSTTFKVLSAKKVISSYNIESGDLLTIDARDKSNYQLIDDKTGFGPQNIIAKRDGKDLTIFLENGDMVPDIIIKGYYGDENGENVTNLIVGEHENGKIYAYVPESGEKEDAVSMLQDQDAEPQALGGNELVSPFWAFNPWWLLALLPLAALAFTGGKKGHKDTTAPEAPTVVGEKDGTVTVKPPKDEDVKTVEVDYIDENGTAKKVTATKGDDGKWTISPNEDGITVDPETGVITLPATALKDGSEVSARATDDSGNVSPDGKDTVARLPGDSNGDGKTDGDDDSSNMVIIPKPPKLPKNTGDAPEIFFGEDKNEDSKLNRKEVGEDNSTPVYITLPPTTKVGDKVIVSVDGGEPKEVPVTQADLDKGYVTIDVPVTVPDTKQIDVAAKVVDGETGESTPETTKSIEVDTVAPSKPEVIAQENGDVIVKLPIDAEPGDTTEITFTPEGSDTPVKVVLTKDKDGNWISDKPDLIPDVPAGNDVVIPEDKVKDNSPVTAVAKDPAGNTSEPSTDIAKAPKQPEVVPPANESDVPEIVFGEDTNNDDKLNAREVGEDNSTPVHVSIPKGANPQVGDNVVVSVNGEPKEIPVTQEILDKGFVTVDVPVTPETTKIDVAAKLTDPTGNDKSPEATKSIEVDVVAPSTPTVTGKPNGDVVVDLPEDAKPNDTVEVTFNPEGAEEPVTVVLTKDPDGGWKSNNPDLIPDVPAGEDLVIPENKVKDETPVTAIAKDPFDNVSEPSTDTAQTPPDAFILPRNIDGKPVIFFPEDADKNGVINKAEIDDVDSQDTTPVYITIPDNTAEGDKMVVTVNGEEKEIPLTEADIERGYVQVDVPVTERIQPIEVKAQVIAPKGESAIGEGKVTVDTREPGNLDNIDPQNDTSKPNADKSPDEPKNPVLPNGKELLRTIDGAPGVYFPEDENGDDKLNAQEVGEDKSTPVYIGIPENSYVGDTVIVDINGTKHEIPVTKENFDEGFVKIDVPTDSLPKDDEGKQVIDVKAKVITPAGNESNPGTGKVTVDTDLPGDVDNDGDADNDDNNPDDTREVPIDGKPYPRTVNGAPNIIFGDDVLEPVGTLNTTEIGEDKETKIYITIPVNTYFGDTIEITVNGEERPTRTLNSLDIAKGYIELDEPVTTETKELLVTAKVVDDAGNESNLGTNSIIVDFQAPGDEDGDGVVDVGPILEIPEAEGGVNKAELEDGIQTLVTPPKGSEPGDTIAVELKDENGEPVKDENGNPIVVEEKIPEGWEEGTPVEVTIPKDVLPKDEKGEPKNDTYKPTAKVFDDAGNTSKDSDPVDVVIDTTSPEKPDVDAKPDGSVIITPPEATEDDNDPKEVEITFTPEGATEPTTIVAKKDDEGKWSLPEGTDPEITIDPDTGVVTIPEDKVADNTEVTAIAKDNAGNPSDEDKDTALAGGNKPDIEIVGAKDDKQIDPEDLNEDKQAVAKVTPPAGSKPGDKLKVTINGEEQPERVLTEDDFDEGKPKPIEYPFEPKQPEGSTNEVKAIVTDKDGNNPTDENRETAKTDLLTPGENPALTPEENKELSPEEKAALKPQVVIDDGGDGFLNADEVASGKVDATVTFPANGGYAVGDKVSIVDQDGKELLPERELTEADLKDGIKVEVPVESLPDGVTVKVVATVKDGQDDKKAPVSGEDASVIDLDGPEKPDVEAKPNGAVTITPPPATEDDNDPRTVEITYTPQGEEEPKTIVATKGEDDKWSLPEEVDPAITIDPETGVVTIPEDKVEDGSYVEAIAKDEADNPSEPDNDQALAGDSKPTAEIVGAENDKQIDPEDLVDGKAVATVTLPEGTKVGDKLNVTINGVEQPEKVLTQDDIDEGVTYPFDPKPEGETNVVKAVLTDKDGNFPTEDEATAVTDLNSPGRPNGMTEDEFNNLPQSEKDALKPQVKIDDGGDDILNAKEIENGTVPAKVTFPENAGYTPGDKVKIVDQDGNELLPERELTADDIANGIDVPVPVKDLADGTKVKVTATVTDGQDPVKTAVGEDTSTVDTDAPEKPDVEAKVDGSVTITPPPATTDDNDPKEVEITYIPEGATEPTTLVATKGDDDKWSLPEGTDPAITIDPETGLVTIPEDKVADNTEVKAIAKDEAGNPSEEDKDKALAEGAPTVEINGTEGDDNQIDPEDLVDGKAVVAVTPPAGSKPGDTLKVTINDEPQADKVLTADDFEADGTTPKAIEYPFEPKAEGENNVVTAKVIDSEGVESKEGKDEAVTDLLTPGENPNLTPKENEELSPEEKAALKPQVVIDDGGDDFLNADEVASGKVDATVTFPANGGYAVGDKVSIVDQDGNVLLPERELTADDLAKGITVPVNVSGLEDGKEVKVVATVKDGQDDKKAPVSGEDASVIDLDGPEKPDVVAQPNGSVMIAPPPATEDDNDPRTVEITYTPEGATEPTTIVATKGDDDKWSLPEGTDPAITIDPETGLVTIPEDKVADNTEVKAIAKDEAGNPSPEDTDTAKAAGSPDVEIVGAKDDKQIDPEDLVDGKAVAKVTPLAGTKPGDKLNVTINGESQPEKVLTADDFEEDGTTPKAIEYPFTPKAEGEENLVEATVTNATTDAVSPKGEAKAVTDLLTPSKEPTVEILDGGDELLNAEEVKSGTVDAKVTFPEEGNYAVGDKVTVVDQAGNILVDEAGNRLEDHELTEANLKDGIVAKVPVAGLADDTVVEVTATVTDKQNADKSVSGKDTSKVDLDGPAIAPDVVAQLNGSVTIDPPLATEDDNNPRSMDIEYIPEGETTPVTITPTKGEDGKWSLPAEDKAGNPIDPAITIDPETGKVTIPADTVADETEVKAIAKDEAGNPSPEDKDTAKPSEAVIVSVKSPAEVNEGEDLISVVTLSNKAGKPDVKIGLEKDTKDGTGRKATNESDFGTQKVTYVDPTTNEEVELSPNANGNYDIPEGVDEVKVINPVLRDEMFEGPELARVKAGDKQGDVVVVNDTSLTNTPTIEIGSSNDYPYADIPDQVDEEGNPITDSAVLELVKATREREYLKDEEVAADGVIDSIKVTIPGPDENGEGAAKPGDYVVVYHNQSDYNQGDDIEIARILVTNDNIGKEVELQPLLKTPLKAEHGKFVNLAAVVERNGNPVSDFGGDEAYRDTGSELKSIIGGYVVRGGTDVVDASVPYEEDIEVSVVGREVVAFNHEDRQDTDVLVGYKAPYVVERDGKYTLSTVANAVQSSDNLRDPTLLLLNAETGGMSGDTVRVTIFLPADSQIGDTITYEIFKGAYVGRDTLFEESVVGSKTKTLTAEDILAGYIVEKNVSIYSTDFLRKKSEAGEIEYGTVSGIYVKATLTDKLGNVGVLEGKRNAKDGTWSQVANLEEKSSGEGTEPTRVTISVSGQGTTTHSDGNQYPATEEGNTEGLTFSVHLDKAPDVEGGVVAVFIPLHDGLTAEDIDMDAIQVMNGNEPLTGATVQLGKNGTDNLDVIQVLIPLPLELNENKAFTFKVKAKSDVDIEKLERVQATIVNSDSVLQTEDGTSIAKIGVPGEAVGLIVDTSPSRPFIDIEQIGTDKQTGDDDNAANEASYAFVTPSEAAGGLHVEGISQELVGKTVTVKVDSLPSVTATAVVDEDGNWKVKLPSFPEGAYNPQTPYKITVTGTTDSGVTVTDTDTTAPLPQVVSMHLVDDLTDEALPAGMTYNESQFTGDINAAADGSVTDVRSALDSAVTKATGLTNDKDAKLVFTLDTPLVAGQTLKVYRYALSETDGTPYEKTLIEGAVSMDGLTYSVVPPAMGDTYGQGYRYEVVLADHNGEDISLGDKSKFNFRLDTLVEQMSVETFDLTSGKVVFAPNALSEVGATIEYRYAQGTDTEPTTDWASVTQNAAGKYELTLSNFNRFTAGALELRVTDAAGNVATSEVSVLRNLTARMNQEEGPDPNQRGTTVGANLTYGNGGIDDAGTGSPEQPITTKAEGAFVFTEGNDTLIVGLDFANFGKDPNLNGTFGSTGTLRNWGNIESGSGDDSLQFRGNAQSMYGAAFNLGAGSDRLVVENGLNVGEYIVDLGDGLDKAGDTNIFHSGNNIDNTAKLSITGGAGNDTVRVDGNFDGNKSLKLGAGDNKLLVGYGTKGGSNLIKRTTFEALDGNDTVSVKGSITTTAGETQVFNFGEGHNFLEVGGSVNSDGKFTFGGGNDTISIKDTLRNGTFDLGAGNDIVTVGKLDKISTADSPKVNLGEGDDTFIITGNKFDIEANGVDGGEGHDTLILQGADLSASTKNFANFNVIDMRGTSGATGNQKVGVSLDYLKDDNTHSLYINGDAGDTVDFGDNGGNGTSGARDGANGLKEFRDGGGGTLDTQRNLWNVWQKTGETFKDGVSYDKYTYYGAAGETSNEIVYIQQGITII